MESRGQEGRLDGPGTSRKDRRGRDLARPGDEEGCKSVNTFGRSVEKTQTKTKRAFGGLTRGVVGLTAGFLGTAGLISVTRAAFGEMAEAQKVSAQTEAVLKSTGKAANVSAKQVDTLAESLMTMSGVDDELIKQGENLLLTFTSIRNETGKGNDIFTQATRTMLDMSVALGQDATRSAMQLGKALNDPIKGVTALRRVGVQFTDAQTDQIKALVKSGKTLQAQKIILRELQREFGGSAKAAGETLPGKLNILRNTLLNLAGSIAAMLTPAITKLVDKMVAWLSKSKNQKAVLDTVKAAASAVETVVRLLVGAFQVLNKITGSTKNTFLLLLGAFVTFKALKLGAYILRMAAAMRAFAIASAAANVASGGGVLGPGGKAGRLGRLGRIAGRVAGRAALPVAVAVGAHQELRHPNRMRGRIEKSDSIRLYLDGKEVARTQGRHNESVQMKRRRQRAHQRRSTR